MAAEAPKPPQPASTAAAAMPPGGGVDLGKDFFGELGEDFLEDFDTQFETALGPAGPQVAAPAAGEPAHGIVYEQSPVRELFADIAANYVRAVREFMIEVHRGDTPKDWINVCEPSVLNFKKAAEKMDLFDVCKAADEYYAALKLAAGAEGRMIGGEFREELILAYSKLIEIMPQTFTLNQEIEQRDSIIIHSLLQQIPEVRKVTIDKIYAAGLTTLEVIFLAQPEDLGATAGIPDWLSEKIVDKFQSYRKEMQSVAPDANRSAERAKLRTLITDLREQQEGYERASSGWTEDAAEEKKRLRQARQDTLLQINVVLAQLGEVDLIHELEKLPFERRIERLSQFLIEGMAGEIPM